VKRAIQWKGLRDSVTHYADDDSCKDRSSPLFRWFFASRGYLDRRFSRIDRSLRAVELALAKMGVKLSEATDKLDRIDARTNDLGVLVRQLRDELANQSDASPEVLRRLGVVADALDAIAADPENPTPPVDDPDVPDDPTPDVPSI
jgi:hypothetical protein